MAVHTAVYGRIAFLNTAVNIVLHALYHAVVCRLRVSIINDRLELVRIAQLLLLLNVAQRIIANKSVHLVHILNAMLLRHLLTFHVKQVLRIIHGLWFRGVVTL